ncbi:MAG: protein BatD [Ignavibacteriales bacterium]|nr:protein BatD [Ignavibacteriales bacterium]
MKKIFRKNCGRKQVMLFALTKIGKMTSKILLIILLFGSLNYAQKFYASVDKNKVGLNEQFEISFTFEGKDINSLNNFTPPAFTNFLALSGPNQSTSMQIINGNVSASRTYSYYLQPRSIGKYSIGSASIQFDGGTFKTQPLTIEVVKGNTQPQQQSNDNTISNADIADNLFIRAIVDKQKVYLGEQVTVVYKLYTRLNIASQMSINKLPNYEGFWSEEIETANNIDFTTEVINGKQYRVGVLKRAALFPSQTGELSITPFELNVPVQIQKKKRSNNIFDDFFNDPFGRSETYEYNAKSNTVKISVLPLPEAKKPESFAGAVGRFEITSSIEQKKYKTNEPITLKLTISGSGNIKLLNIPELTLPTGLDKYEPKTDEQISAGAVVTGVKTIEYVIVPRIAGRKEIPPIEFSYFDPSKKSYVTLTTQSYTIDIAQGEANISEYTNKQGVETLDQDIRYLKIESDDISNNSGIVLFQFGYWVSFIVPLVTVVLLVNWKRRQDKLSGNVQLMKYQRAQKVAKNRLKAAKKLSEENKVEIFFTEISLALFGYLEDKLHISKAEFTLDHACEILKGKKIPDQIIDELRDSVQKCEFVRFAPNTDGETAMKEMYESISHVIIEIERSIK